MQDLINRQAAIDTEGLDAQIRCEMCRNPMHTNRGCDGNCKYDEKLYEKIMQILNERIKPLPSAQPEERTEERTETHACDCISRQAAIDAFDLRDDAFLLVAIIKSKIKKLPSAQPSLDEWCTDCKEYDQERHCCPRWNRVIRETLKEAQAERQRGTWIVLKHTKHAMCSKCHRTFVDAYDLENWDNYCRHCGAVMESIVAEEEWDWNTQNT